VKKRDLDILVLSDLHLGTNQCRSGRLLKYLKSVNPKMLILNGDIVDFWLLDLKKWPKKHTKILAYFFNLMVEKVPIYYLPGNHDDYLKQFAGMQFHNFELKNELILNLNGEKTWFMHGDKDDKSVNGAKRKQNDIDTVVCGHVHRPGITKVVSLKTKKEINYLNSGDWTESCTALEYVDDKWSLYRYKYNYTQHESTLKNVRFEQSDVYPFLRKKD